MPTGEVRHPRPLKELKTSNARCDENAIVDLFSLLLLCSCRFFTSHKLQHIDTDAFNQFCDAASLKTRAVVATLWSSSPSSPRRRSRDPIEMNITWLLRNVAAFKIDRNQKSTRTPRRNAQVESALWAFEALHGWCARVASYFQTSVFTAQAQDKLDMGAINDNGVFVPFVPLMLPPAADAKTGTLLPAKDQEAFIGDRYRCRRSTRRFPTRKSW